jgi:hypothetical protein
VIEIFETGRTTTRRGQEKFAWSKLWEGKPTRHLLPGKDSGDMLSGKNASVLATLLAERIREAFDSSVCEQEESAVVGCQVSEVASRLKSGLAVTGTRHERRRFFSPISIA